MKQVNFDAKEIEKIEDLLTLCRDEAEKQGWRGDDDDFEYTEADMDSVTDDLGYKPTRKQWEEAGLKHVGGRHCA
jgi:hypothetical protein